MIRDDTRARRNRAALTAALAVSMLMPATAAFAEPEPQADARTASGRIEFLPGTAPEDVQSFWQMLRIDAAVVSGDAAACPVPGDEIPFDSVSFDPDAATWSVTGLGPCVYEFSFVNGFSSPGEGYPDEDHAVAAQTDVDLRAGDRADLVATAGRGRVRLVLGSDTEAGLIERSTLTNLDTGARAQVGAYGSYGDYWWIAAAVEPGRYTLKLTTGIGIRYYDGTPRGTTDPGRATPIEVRSLHTTELSPLEPGIWLSNDDLPWFSDVRSGDRFSGEIRWMQLNGLTTGVRQPDGTAKFMPKSQVTREAMAAFLFRLNGSAEPHEGPSPFVDVTPGHQFYDEIVWAYENGVTTGIRRPDGTLEFAPKAAITREAMAAFMYRLYFSDRLPKPGSSRFADVPSGHKFAKEINWMAANRITTGSYENGALRFHPKRATTREATAAFLSRAENFNRG